MNDLFTYFIWSGLSLVVMYSFYLLFLYRETCFGCIRFYLLFSLVFSVLIPFVPDWVATRSIAPQNFSISLNPVSIYLENPLPDSNQSFSIRQVLVWIYLSGIIISLLRLMFQLGQIILLTRKTGIHRDFGVKVVYTGKCYTNFSFFDIVFLNSAENTGNEIQKIIDHEKVHIRQKHYLDLILIELMTIIFWFNPFIWFYKQSIKAVHEYLADEGVLKNGHNKIDYQKLLVNQSFGIQVYALTNNFNQSLIKRRFTMMSKSKLKLRTMIKILFAVPLMLILAFVFSCNNTVSEKSPDAFTVVEEMPVYKGGDEARIKYLNENIRYPAEARKNGIEGRVFVTFIVEKDGKISNVELLRGIGGGCDEEALRVISNMPQWEPGKQRGKPVRVQFNMPILFKLNSEKKTNTGI